VGNLREARLSIAFKPGGNAFTPSFFILERSDLAREAWTRTRTPGGGDGGRRTGMRQRLAAALAGRQAGLIHS
jgi:hypothetical protein